MCVVIARPPLWLQCHNISIGQYSEIFFGQTQNHQPHHQNRKRRAFFCNYSITRFYSLTSKGWLSKGTCNLGKSGIFYRTYIQYWMRYKAMDVTCTISLWRARDCSYEKPLHPRDVLTIVPVISVNLYVFSLQVEQQRRSDHFCQRLARRIVMARRQWRWNYKLSAGMFRVPRSFGNPRRHTSWRHVLRNLRVNCPSWSQQR